MPYTVTCPQCQEENAGHQFSCVKCGTNLIGIPRQNQSVSQEPKASSFTYESSRIANLMAEYSKITTIRECREWEGKAQLVADYMSDAIAKTDNFILIEKERLERESNGSEHPNNNMGLMQYESFRNIIGSQLERLTKTINDLPKGENVNETVSLPSENVTLQKQQSKIPSIDSRVIRLIVLTIIIFLMWYFSNVR